jgi:hypothetical protein
LDDITKIGKIAEVVSDNEVEFKIRRTEGVDNAEIFKKLHNKFGLTCKVTQISCKSEGKLKMAKFLKFLKEYHSEFSLDPTVVEIGAVVINPVLL